MAIFICRTRHIVSSSRSPPLTLNCARSLTRVVGELFGLRCIEADEFRVVVNSGALTEWITEIGFKGLSLTKAGSGLVYSDPVDQRLAFLGGWIDADGYARTRRQRFGLLTCANEPLMQQARSWQVGGLRAGGPWSFTQPYRHDPGARPDCLAPGDFGRLRTSGGVVIPKRTDRFGRRHFHSSNVRMARLFALRWLGFEAGQVHRAVRRRTRVRRRGRRTAHPNFVAEGLVVTTPRWSTTRSREDLEAQGVIFLDTDTGPKEHPEIFQCFGTVIPAGDNKFSALNTAVWSGGSFIYAPPGVHVDIPLQAFPDHREHGSVRSER